MKKTNFLFIALFALIIVVGGCSKKEDVSPNAKLVGTWKIQSANIKDSSQDFDFWALYNAFYPCTKQITMTFTDDLKYSVFEPGDCKDKNGESLFIFTKTGSFQLTDNTKLDIIDSGATPYKGTVVFETGKFTWTYTETDGGVTSTITMVFVKA